MTIKSPADGDRAAVSTRTVEIAVALILFALGALVVFDSYRLGSKWGSDGPQSGYFPVLYRPADLHFERVTLAQAAVGKSVKRDASHSSSGGPFKRVLTVLVPAALYVLGIKFIGLYVASAIYIAVFMVWLGKYAWWKSVAVGVGDQRHFFRDVRSLVQGAAVQGRA